MELRTESDGNVYVYTENFWTGKRELTFNGVALQKENKKTFIVNCNDGMIRRIKVKGNFLSGVTLLTEWGNIVMTKNKWYEWILIFLPLIGVFGGVLGGAIGGGLSAVCCLAGCVFNATILRGELSLPLKILFCILIVIAANLLWFLIYVMIVGGLSKVFG